MKDVIGKEEKRKKLCFEHFRVDLNKKNIGLLELLDSKYTKHKKDIKIRESHFLYTGGTKIMVNLFLFELIQSKVKETFFFSYLDPKKQLLRTHKVVKKRKSLKIEGLNEESIERMKEEINLNLEKIIKIHGIKLVNIDNNVNKNLIENKTLIKKLLSGYISAYNEQLLIEIENELKRKKNTDFLFTESEQKKNKLKKEFDKIVKELKLENNIQSILNKENRKEQYIELNNIVNFLRGTWLEQVIYLALKKDESEKKIYKNVIIEHKGRKAEVDVIIVEGLKIKVVSVTTSRKIGLIKLKLFEVIHRANQIGGIRSKIIMITLAEKWKIEQLTRDISQFEQMDRIEIWGKNDVMNLLKNKKVFE